MPVAITVKLLLLFFGWISLSLPSHASPGAKAIAYRTVLKVLKSRGFVRDAFYRDMSGQMLNRVEHAAKGESSYIEHYKQLNLAVWQQSLDSGIDRPIETIYNEASQLAESFLENAQEDKSILQESFADFECDLVHAMYPW